MWGRIAKQRALERRLREANDEANEERRRLIDHSAWLKGNKWSVLLPKEILGLLWVFVDDVDLCAICKPWYDKSRQKNSLRPMSTLEELVFRHRNWIDEVDRHGRQLEAKKAHQK